jgi:uncharacterized protein DUF3187
MAAAAVFCLGAAAPAAPGDGALRATLDAPLPVRGQFPLMLGFLDITPGSAFTPAPGTLTFAAGLAYESTHAASDDILGIYAMDDFATLGGRVTREILAETAADSSSGWAYFVDGETGRLTLDLDWGISRRVELRAGVPLLYHSGGFMDGGIDAYHETFGLSDGGRSDFARNQYVVGLSQDGTTVFIDGAPGGLGLGDMLLETRVALAPAAAAGFALAATASIELPTGDPDRGDGNGSLDAAAGLAASWRLRRWSLHAGSQYAWLGSWDPAPDLAPRNRLAGYFSGALLLGERNALVSGLVAGTGPFERRGGGSLGDTAMEISIGMRHATVSAGVFEAALLENLLPDHNVPDVGFYVGWSRAHRFR